MKKNTQVFTDKSILEMMSPILFVYHDHEDDWQFLGSDSNQDEEDARVVSIGEILAMDSSIESILDMPLGVMAQRKDRDSEWSFYKIKE